MDAKKKRAAGCIPQQGFFRHWCAFYPTDPASAFPIELLWLEQAWPDSQIDAKRIESPPPLGAGRVITLGKHHECGDVAKAWNFEMWRAQGWVPSAQSTMDDVRSRGEDEFPELQDDLPEDSEQDS